MRLSDDQLKAAIVHPNVVVRTAALRSFHYSQRQHPDLLPTAIRAVEQHGWDAFLGRATEFEKLQITDINSYLWVHSRMTMELNKQFDSPKWVLRRMLMRADAEVLEQAFYIDGTEIDPAGEAYIETRLEMLSLKPDEIWKDLTSTCNELIASAEFSDQLLSQARALIGPMRRHQEWARGRVMEVLSRPPETDEENANHWLVGLAMYFAGELRIDEAAPLLWDLLAHDWTWYSEEAMHALCRIGTPSVLNMISERYEAAERHVRHYANRPFEEIRSESGSELIKNLLAIEVDGILRSNLVTGAARQYDRVGAEVAYGTLMSKCGDLFDVPRALILYSHLADWPLPNRTELEHQEINFYQNIWEENERFMSDGSKNDSDPTLPVEPTDPEPVQLVQLVGSAPGRNDPCPCGSGKKYKKCCWR